MNDMRMDRKQLEFDIVKSILDALNRDAITYLEAQKAAKHFLLYFDAAADAALFLDDLAKKWDIFTPLKEKYAVQSKYSQEDELKLEKIKEQLTHFAQG